jgi:hypothetical protein
MVELSPQSFSRAYVDGHEVPYIDVGVTDEGFTLILDNRFGIDASPEELQKWLPFVADAMAVSAGRTSHGRNSNIRNPHGEALAGYLTKRFQGGPVTESING